MVGLIPLMSSLIQPKFVYALSRLSKSFFLLNLTYFSTYNLPLPKNAYLKLGGRGLNSNVGGFSSTSSPFFQVFTLIFFKGRGTW